MRRALIVGIDEYPDSPLLGCVNDASRMARLLESHEDGSPNFSCRVLTGPPLSITKPILHGKIDELFAHEADVALLYFSGHGTVRNMGGYLVTPDAKRYNEGVSMAEVAELASNSPVKEVVILLDCCHSGNLGAVPALNNATVLREGVSILTASRGSQVSVEIGGSGLFTTLVCAALEGGAADVIGKVSIASIYAYVDQALGPWEQRPLFKTLVSRLIPLRNCKPVVPLEQLRLLPVYFPRSDHELRLDPSFEPSLPPPNTINEIIFADLQKYRAARLLVPIEEEHMFYAAANSKSCKLTPLGRFYWALAKGHKL